MFLQIRYPLDCFRWLGRLGFVWFPFQSQQRRGFHQGFPEAPHLRPSDLRLLIQAATSPAALEDLKSSLATAFAAPSLLNASFCAYGQSHSGLVGNELTHPGGVLSLFNRVIPKTPQFAALVFWRSFPKPPRFAALVVFWKPLMSEVSEAFRGSTNPAWMPGGC